MRPRHATRTSRVSGRGALYVLVGVEIKVEVLDLVPAIGQKHRSDRRGSIARLTPPSPALATVPARGGRDPARSSRRLAQVRLQRCHRARLEEGGDDLPAPSGGRGVEVFAGLALEYAPLRGDLGSEVVGQVSEVDAGFPRWPSYGSAAGRTS